MDTRVFCGLGRMLWIDFEHGFGNSPGMHRFERVMPMLDAPRPSNNLSHIDRAALQQKTDSFPNRPSVREATLKRDILLDQRIERKPNGIASPSHLANPTRRPNHIDGRTQGR